MKRMTPLLMAGAVFVLCGMALATMQVVIIQAYRPEEGGFTKQKENTVFWTDGYLMTELMASTRFGRRLEFDTIPLDRIHVLYAEGRDWPMARYHRRYDPARRFNPPWITDAPADTQHIRTLFDSLATTTDSLHDTLLLYTFGHGGSDAITIPPHPTNYATIRHVSLMVRADADTANHTFVNLWDTTLARMLEPIHVAKRIVIAAECFCGGLIDDLAGRNTTLICATNQYSKSWLADNHHRPVSPWDEYDVYWSGGLPTDTLYHAEFNFHFMNALRGHLPYDTAFTDSIEADRNGNGTVPLFEAYQYDSLCSTTGRPIYQDEIMYWGFLAPMPVTPTRSRRVKDGGALTVLGDTIFGLKGNGTCEYYAYVIGRDSWATRESIPPMGSANRKKTVKKGATLAAAGDKGNNSVEFWRYEPGAAGFPWQRLADVPAGAKTIKEGAGAVGVEVNSTSYVYLLKGSGTCEFYRYDTSIGTWATMAAAPSGASGKAFKNGSCIAYDPVENVIYALKARYNEFFKYDVESNTWTTLASLPLIGIHSRKQVKDGGALAYRNGRVYALKGNNSLEFYAYTCSLGTWGTRECVPIGVANKGVKGGEHWSAPARSSTP
ncbi:MAG: hypothetical protein ABIK62_01670 [candidate division WOR-3 bacterium]